MIRALNSRLDWLTDWLTDWLSDWLIDWLMIDWLSNALLVSYIRCGEERVIPTASNARASSLARKETLKHAVKRDEFRNNGFMIFAITAFYSVYRLHFKPAVFSASLSLHYALLTGPGRTRYKGIKGIKELILPPPQKKLPKLDLTTAAI